MKTGIKISHSASRIVFLMAFMCLGTMLSGQKTQSKNETRTPLLKASVKVSSSCKAGYTCGTWLGSIQKVNAIKITNQSYSWYPSLLVEIYPCSGPTPSCAAIASFVCNQQVITYASTQLTNGGNFYVKLTDTQSNNSVGYNFTNGHHNGKICRTGGSEVTRN